MNKLEKEFIGAGEVKGFKFRQTKATDTHYLYEVEKVGGSMHYEVFERKTVPLCINFATREYSTTETKEIYPRGKDFGLWAWSFKDKTKAMERM